MRPSSFFVPVLFLLIVLSGFLPRMLRPQAPHSEILPSTSMYPPGKVDPDTNPSVVVQPVFPGLEEFAASVLNGHAGEVVGIYVEDLFALPVVQQPKNEPAFVSPEDNQLTQFSMPTDYGVIGLLAHNYLSGKLFYHLLPDDRIVVIYGNGRSELFRVTRSESFQALNPSSPYSEFVNTEDPSGRKITSASLFSHVYTSPDSLVFQTCIEANGDPSWGRLFVTAEKETSIKIHLPGMTELSNN